MSIKIILAESHPIIRQDLTLLLAVEPYLQVMGEAGDFSTTLKLIRELSPQVVIMDISMPDSNGVEAARSISSQFPQIKMITLSMHSDSLFVLNMLDAGAGAIC